MARIKGFSAEESDADMNSPGKGFRWLEIGEELLEGDEYMQLSGFFRCTGLSGTKALVHRCYRRAKENS